MKELIFSDEVDMQLTVYPPGTDIWWPRAELGHLQMMCTEELKFTPSPVLTSGKVYMLLKFTPLIWCLAVVEVSNTLQ